MKNTSIISTFRIEKENREWNKNKKYRDGYELQKNLNALYRHYILKVEKLRKKEKWWKKNIFLNGGEIIYKLL